MRWTSGWTEFLSGHASDVGPKLAVRFASCRKQRPRALHLSTRIPKAPPLAGSKGSAPGLPTLENPAALPSERRQDLRVAGIPNGWSGQQPAHHGPNPMRVDLHELRDLRVGRPWHDLLPGAALDDPAAAMMVMRLAI